jgi:hypothetical protein
VAHSQPANNYIFLQKWECLSLRGRPFVHSGTTSAVKRTDFVSYKALYTKLRGSWCDILNVHTPTEDKSHKTPFTTPYIPHENFIRRFQCKSRERTFDKVDNQE